MRITLAALTAFLLLGPLNAQDHYQKPPKAIQDVFDAPAPPSLIPSPSGDAVLLMQVERYPGIRELARPMLRLAGSRLDPRTRSPHRTTKLTSLVLKLIPGIGEVQILLPANIRMGTPQWAPDGRHFAIEGVSDRSVELWIGDGRTGRLRKVPELRLNATFGNPVDWINGKNLLCLAVPANQGPAPKELEAPTGPRIQEHDPAKGKGGPLRTLEDLLQNAHDEDLYAYYATSQLVRVDLATLKLTRLGKPDLIANVQPAPDGLHTLVYTIHKPFSFLVADNDFPQTIKVWDTSGNPIHTVADLPLAEDIPIQGVRKGPRSIHWRPTEPATLAWVEALDGGDPKTKVEHRDKIMLQSAPFKTQPAELTRLQHRFAGIEWGEHGDLAVLREFDRDKRWNRTWFMDPRKPETKPRLVFDLSAQDAYKNPGRFVQKRLPNGGNVLRQEANSLFLAGAGATQKGDRPFLTRFDMTSSKIEDIFRCGDSVYESSIALLPDGGYITRRESATEPPNYVVHPTGKGEAAQLTHFTDPAPILRKITKKLVRYKRPDGVDLSFTLYLPPDYKDGERRPAVVWAYPLEFTNAGDAGQVSGSTDRFTSMGGASHLFFLLQGYVVLDAATMPVVGDPETVNNTYLEQVVGSAKAAIDKAAEMGVIDPKRVGVGGHSYGAFMTANLLAHSDLFKAGIARSGAYNRTLTPFGFQSERRTIWEAPEMYLKVSPFMSANKFHAPILLIHGEADDNSGTFPVQSERLFAALKGNNQAVRYVTLPNEAHGYAAKESLEHCLWEMISWFDRHLK